MIKDNCLACDTLVGKLQTPGGVIYENDYWLVDHALPPIFVLGKLIIKLKRHCEHLAELTPNKSQTLGSLIQRVSQVVQEVTSAEKVHIASYGEGVKHVHFLVTPQIVGMPASNIRLVYWLQKQRLLYQFGWRSKAFKPNEAAEIVEEIRAKMVTKVDLL